MAMAYDELTFNYSTGPMGDTVESPETIESQDFACIDLKID